MKTIKNQSEFDELIKAGVKNFSEYQYLGETLYCVNNELTKLPALNSCEKLFCAHNACRYV
jgi:hypothetical protein